MLSNVVFSGNLYNSILNLSCFFDAQWIDGSGWVRGICPSTDENTIDWYVGYFSDHGIDMALTGIVSMGRYYKGKWEFKGYCSQVRNALDCAFREKTYGLKAKIHLRTNEVRIAIFA